MKRLLSLLPATLLALALATPAQAQLMVGSDRLP